MKPEKDNGGPAFPQASPEMVITGQSMGETQGMSLRDYFAAAALQGLLAHLIGVENANGNASKYAGRAYQYADAMLAARKEGA
jgi:hypothetical protein